MLLKEVELIDEVDIEKEEIKSPIYVFLSKRYWQLFFMCLLSNFYGGTFSYTFKPFAEDPTSHKPINDRFMSVAAAVGSGLVNGSTRILMGLLVDKFTFKSLFAIIVSI